MPRNPLVETITAIAQMALLHGQAPVAIVTVSMEDGVTPGLWSTDENAVPAKALVKEIAKLEGDGGTRRIKVSYIASINERILEAHTEITACHREITDCLADLKESRLDLAIARRELKDLLALLRAVTKPLGG